MARSYSIQYIFGLIDRFSPGSKKLAASANKMSGSVHAAGKGANVLSGALGRLGKTTAITSKKTAALGKTTKTAAGGATALARGSKSAASGVSMIGKAASAALAPLKALQAQMARVGRTALYNRGLVSMGGYEAANTKRGAYHVMAARQKDEAMRNAYTARGSKGRQGGGFFRSSGRLHSRGFSPMFYGGGAGGMGAMGGGYGAYSLLKSFADFESAEIEVRTIGKRVGQSKSELDALMKVSRKLGASTMFEPQDILGGGLRFLKSGYGARDAAQALPSTLDLAALSGQNVETTTDQVLNIMAQAKIPAEKLKQTTNQLYSSFINAKAELGQLATAAGYGLTQMTDAGITTEQGFATLAAMSQGGQIGSKSGRGFAMALSSLGKAKFSKQKQGVMKRYGFDIDEYFSKGRLKNAESFTRLMEKLSQIHKKDATFLPQLFPANADRAIRAAIVNYETFNKVLSENKRLSTSNAASEDAAARFRGLSGAVRQLGAAWSELGIAFGKSGVGQVVERAVRGITSAFSGMSEALDAGAFLEQLLDPALLAGRIAILGVRMGQALAKAMLGAVQSAMNAVSETLGAGRLGDWFREWTGFDEKMAEVDERLARIGKKMTGRQEYINERARVAKSRGHEKLMAKRHGAFDRQSYGKFISGADFSGLRNNAAPPPQFRIPQAAAERVQIENSVSVQTDFAPATVNVTGRLEGLAGVAAMINGSGKLQANRGTASSEAGTVASSPAP
jgi:TP901 family phage tail tape measure protein